MEKFWHSVTYNLPPENQIVWTKIWDGDGERNVTRLKRIGNLWFYPEGDMYVYYRPTHWCSEE
jgi:hypothetical protein